MASSATLPRAMPWPFVKFRGVNRRKDTYHSSSTTLPSCQGAEISMRQSSHGVTSCAVPLTSGKKYVAVQLLTKETLYCEVDIKGKAQHVFDQVCSYLGLKDAELFGLALLSDNEYLFLDHGTKLVKLAPKAWKSTTNYGLDSIGRALLMLHLCIKFYVDCPTLVRDKQTRHHYYLQVKLNFLQHCQACSEERCFLLAAYALQADFGNFCDDKHQYRYFEPRDYFPPWMVSSFGEDYIVRNAPSIHKDYKNYSKADAEMAFIREASSMDAPHNLHVYKLKKKKNDLLGSVWLGVCSKGIEIYENGGINSRTKKLVSTFLWGDIGKLCFEKKKFEIRAMSYSDTRKYTYYTGNDEKSKHLLHLCRSTHLFHLAMQPKVTELKRLEMEEKKSYRESYIYSDSLDLEWEQEHGPSDMSLHDYNTLSKKGKVVNDQRTSVISNASSNTTSGIVSDRVQSLDGSEDEMDSAREPESPQPPVQLIEAINSVVELPSETGIGEQVPKRHQPSVARSVSLSVQPTHGELNYLSQQRNSEPAVPSQDALSGGHHSSSSDKSCASTVRSHFSLVKSSIPSIPPAFSVPYLSYLPLRHSSSDTCSSFDHSYAGSMDYSLTGGAATYLASSRGSAPQLSQGSSSVVPEMRSQSCDFYYDTVPSSCGTMPPPHRPNSGSDQAPLPTFLCAGTITTSTSSPTSTLSRTSMADLYLPPVPIRTEHSYVRSIVTNAARKSTPSTSPQSSNDESSLGYVPSLPSCYPVTSSAGRPPNGVRSGLCLQNNGAAAQCRTKIGVSSLSRPTNSKYSYGPSTHRNAGPSPMTSSQLLGTRYPNCYNFAAYSNLLTLGKSISVPNVIDENECLPMSASATYPPMNTVPFAIRPNYYSSEVLPAYPNRSMIFGGATTPSSSSYVGLTHQYHHQWPVCPDYYLKDVMLDLPRRYSDSPVSPPNEFACIPPPPPYRNPQGSDSDSGTSATGVPISAVTSSRGFCPDRGQLQVAGRVAPTARPRTVPPLKAKSEDNLLSQEAALLSTSCTRPLDLPLTSSKFSLSNVAADDGTEELKGDFPMIPPPPPYGPEVTTASRSMPSSPDGSHHSSASEGFRQKLELPEIQKLRERSRDLGLPLISALCNDRSLMPYQDVHLDGQQAGVDLRRLSYCTPPTGLVRTTLGGRPVSWHVDSGSNYCDHNGLPTLQRANPMSNLAAGMAVPSVLPPTPLTKWTSSHFGAPMTSVSQLPVPVSSVPYSSQNSVPSAPVTSSIGWMTSAGPSTIVNHHQQGIKTVLVSSHGRSDDQR